MMRIVAGSVFLLMIAARPASADEAFVTQVTNKAVAAEQTGIASAKSAYASAMLVLPVKPGALNSFVQPPAAVPGTNISGVVQSGTNNFVAVTQTGSGNASSIVQRGSGNQAIVTQRH